MTTRLAVLVSVGWGMGMWAGVGCGGGSSASSQGALGAAAASTTGTAASTGASAGTSASSSSGGPGDAGTEVLDGLQITSALRLMPSTVSAGQTVQAIATLYNPTEAAITLLAADIAGRTPGGSDNSGPYDDLYDSPAAVTVAAGQSLTLSGSRTIAASDPVGTWYAYVTVEDASGVFHNSTRNVDFTVIAGGTAAGTTAGGTAGTATSGTSTGTGSSTSSSSSGSSGTVTGKFGVQVSGNHLVSTKDGSTLQLRGGDVSCMEGLFLQSTSDYFAGANIGAAPSFFGPMTTTWKFNAVRLPLNEATWLADGPEAYAGQDVMNLGPTVTADNGGQGTYQATVKQFVTDANAAGLYVILDLHWTAPGAYLGDTQDQLPDQDHSIAFWQSMAATFGDNPAVIFDLFNEPYGSASTEADAFTQILNGAPQSDISFNSGKSTIKYSWQSAGMQQMVTAIRNAKAINVLMIGGGSGATDLSGYTVAGGNYLPTDPNHNLAVSWHAYGVSSTGFTMSNASFSGSITPAAIAKTILEEGHPIIVGELGDQCDSASGGAPVTSFITSYADQLGFSVLAWTYDNWGVSSGCSNLLIKDSSGDPTNGEGQTFLSWTQNHK